MDTEALREYIDEFWEQEILPTLSEYITIPCESPSFDKDWAAHGHMERAALLVADWMRAAGPADLRVTVHREGGRTPLILAELPGTAAHTVLLYGHLDKQPPMEGWREGLGPWLPVRDEADRLYGRGGADDGYAAFAAVAVARALREAGQVHGRLVLLIECSEESGSPDLPHYLASCSEQIGTPALVVALDSGAGNYEQLWSTTSLRGILEVVLKVEMLTEGVHSGIAGGIVPSPLRIVRQLLERLEDSRSGVLLPPELHVPILPARMEQAHQAAVVLGEAIATDFPFVPGAQAQLEDPAELLLNNAWRPCLAITGQEGIPLIGEGGNVLYPAVRLKLSIRIPPGVVPSQAGERICSLLETDPPQGARVSCRAGGQPGWEAPPLAPWLERALDAASQEIYGRKACYIGLGGSIPFMEMIGRSFPHAQFLITGVLGPRSNAHGPNEFLHLPYAKRLTCCLARILACAPDLSPRTSQAIGPRRLVAPDGKQGA